MSRAKQASKRKRLTRHWAPRDWVFRWWEAHPHPPFRLPMSRNL